MISASRAARIAGATAPVFLDDEPVREPERIGRPRARKVREIRFLAALHVDGDLPVVSAPARIVTMPGASTGGTRMPPSLRAGLRIEPPGSSHVTSPSTAPFQRTGSPTRLPSPETLFDPVASTSCCTSGRKYGESTSSPATGLGSTAAKTTVPSPRFSSHTNGFPVVNASSAASAGTPRTSAALRKRRPRERREVLLVEGREIRGRSRRSREREEPSRHIGKFEFEGIAAEPLAPLP